MKYLIVLFLVVAVAAQTTITPIIPPYPGDATKYLNGTGAYTVPAGGGTNAANWTASGTTNSTLSGVASAGGGIIVGAATNGGWKALPAVIDMEGGAVYGFESIGFIRNGDIQIEQNQLTNFWGVPSSVVAIYTSVYGDEIPLSVIASNNVSVFVAGEGPIGSGAVFVNNSSVYGIGSFPFAGTIATGNNTLYSWGTDTFDHATVLNSTEVFAYDHDPFYSAYITNGFRVFGRGYRPFLSAVIDGGNRIFADGGNAPLGGSRLTNCVNLSAIGGSAGAGITGSYTNVFLWGDGASPTLTANQHVFGDASVTQYLFPGSAITTAGTFTSGSPSGGTSAAWKFGSYQTNYVEAEVGGTPARLLTVDTNGNVTISGTATIGTGAFTDFTATHLTVTDITDTNKLIATSPTSTALTNGYAAALTNTWGIFTGDITKVVDGTATLANKGDIQTLNINNGQITNNLAVLLVAGNTNIIDVGINSHASVTNYVTQNTSFAYATNGVDNVEVTKVHWLRNSDSTIHTFSIPSTWITNKMAGPPPNLTNGIWTKMICTTLGNTSSAENQTNVLVSFEYY